MLRIVKVFFFGLSAGRTFMRRNSPTAPVVFKESLIHEAYPPASLATAERMMGERGRATLELTGTKTSLPYRNARGRGLTFVRPHVAAVGVLSIWAGHTALISFQQMTQSVGAAVRVARVGRRAGRCESH